MKPDGLGAHVLKAARRELSRFKELGEKAIAQVQRDEDLHARLDRESNSIAILVRHLSGNMVSRWTDFLTTDGEKPDRQRDREFEPVEGESRSRLLATWERGWNRLFTSFDALVAGDLTRTVTIRDEPHTVIEALERQIGHCAYHVGQIVFLAKHFESAKWDTLSIPRGQSEAFFRREKSRGEGPNRSA